MNDKSSQKSNAQSTSSPSRTNTLKKGYMSSIFKPATKNDYNHWICTLCKSKTPILKRNLKRHLQTNIHFNLTPEKDIRKLNDLIAELEDDGAKFRRKLSSIPEDIENKNISSYLEFLAFSTKENLSFLQTKSLANFLKKMAENRKLDFLQHYSFDDEEISLIIRDFGSILHKNLIEDLEASCYSFSIDNSTVGDKNICALKVRYLKEAKKGDKLSLQLQNKVIGIKYLEDSSDGATMYNIVKEKLFDLSEKIKGNFSGIVHDLAKSLTSTEKGLIGNLHKEYEKPFFNLNDPCHCLNLVLKHLLEEVPMETTKFIAKIHSYFTYPQRKAKLRKIQVKNNLG